MVERNKGCSHMTCRCSAQFCYICRAQWKTCKCDALDERLAALRRQPALVRCLEIYEIHLSLIHFRQCTIFDNYFVSPVPGILVSPNFFKCSRLQSLRAIQMNSSVNICAYANMQTTSWANAAGLRPTIYRRLRKALFPSRPLINPLWILH
jgi:hypothetical protein